MLLKRIPDVGGFWQPVTGGIDEGERRIQALQREVIEDWNLEYF